ncbi:MAG: DUF222 domain-containing protein [Ilumatobacter sp.]|nr:DUF222 domain-containing protein [Ilumatobacter sp.]
MDVTAVVEHVEQVVAARAAGRGVAGVDNVQVQEALRSVGKIQAWLSSSRTELTSLLATDDPFPERTAADCTRGSTRDAIKDRERSSTIDHVPAFGGLLDDGDITEAHVDALTNTARNLDNDEQRTELFDRVGDLADVASVATVDEWRRRLSLEAKNIRRNDGIDRLERQRRDTRLSSWTDGDGMICIRGRFDPVTGRKLLGRIDNTVAALFAESVPDTCPTDPVGKQHHLNALALARLVAGDAPSTGRPEYIVVVDTSSSDGNGGPTVDWGIPIEIPHRILAELIDDATVHTIVVRNGVVLHAPGNLDLGRSTRLASPAQRRALRALYPTCAIPGCDTRFDRCKIHHILWWRNGGNTDLDNLLPICTHHHTKIHDADWAIELGPNRQLTIHYPDGTIHNTGPPSRRAA